ncbi:fam-c protein [Plakobranchus ocellatus]|uniref:Fam-c protein n=1 Tax=Plakobranchus ocellatus TaxID=259542 RepID=A0AAV3ZI69_9GAST|nr:fam-c protein [Plakobranchus ocellatus]
MRLSLRILYVCLTQRTTWKPCYLCLQETGFVNFALVSTRRCVISYSNPSIQSSVSFVLDCPFTDSKTKHYLSESKSESFLSDSKSEHSLSESKSESFLSDSKSEHCLSESKGERFLSDSKSEHSLSESKEPNFPTITCRRRAVTVASLAKQGPKSMHSVKRVRDTINVPQAPVRHIDKSNGTATACCRMRRKPKCARRIRYTRKRSST